MGRPSDYSPELGLLICAQLMERRPDGKINSLRDVCAQNGMPTERTIYNWLVSNKEFFQMYTHAREVQGDLHAEDVVYISDTEEDSNRARVRIDARKWWAAKMNKKYGDKSAVEHTGKDGKDLIPDDKPRDNLELARWMALVLTKAGREVDNQDTKE